MRASARGGFGPPMAVPSSRAVGDDVRHSPAALLRACSLGSKPAECTHVCQNCWPPRCRAHVLSGRSLRSARIDRCGPPLREASARRSLTGSNRTRCGDDRTPAEAPPTQNPVPNGAARRSLAGSNRTRCGDDRHPAALACDVRAARSRAEAHRARRRVAALRRGAAAGCRFLAESPAPPIFNF